MTATVNNLRWTSKNIWGNAPNPILDMAYSTPSHNPPHNSHYEAADFVSD